MIFSKNVLFTYGSQLVTVLSSFLSTIIAARLLGQEGQGELSLYNNFTAISILLFGFSLPTGLTYFISSKKLQPNLILSLSVLLLVLGFILFGLSFGILRWTSWLSIFLPPLFHGLGIWIVIAFVHVLFLLIHAMIVAIFQSETRFGDLAFSSIFGSFLLLLLYASRYFQWFNLPISNFEWLIVSLICSIGFQLIYLLVKLYQINHNYFIFNILDVYFIKRILFFCGFVFLANLVQFLNYKMDIWFLNYFFNDRKMIGIYSLGVMLTQMLWLLPSALQRVLYVDVSSSLIRKEIYDKTWQQLKVVSLYALIGGILGYYVSIFFVPLFFGKEFLKSIEIIQILVVGVAVFCTTMPITAYFTGTQRVRINLLGSIIGLTISILGGIFLIPRFGIVGASWVSVGSYVISSIYYILMFLKEKNIIDLRLTKPES